MVLEEENLISDSADRGKGRLKPSEMKNLPVRAALPWALYNPCLSLSTTVKMRQESTLTSSFRHTSKAYTTILRVIAFIRALKMCIIKQDKGLRIFESFGIYNLPLGINGKLHLVNNLA